MLAAVLSNRHWLPRATALRTAQRGAVCGSSLATTRRRATEAQCMQLRGCFLHLRLELSPGRLEGRLVPLNGCILHRLPLSDLLGRRSLLLHLLCSTLQLHLHHSLALLELYVHL